MSEKKASDALDKRSDVDYEIREEIEQKDIVGNNHKRQKSPLFLSQGGRYAPFSFPTAALL